MKRAKRVLLIAPVVRRIQPDWLPDKRFWLPPISRPHVSVQERVGIAQNLDVDSPIAAVTCRAHVFHSGCEQVDVAEIADSLGSGQIREAIDAPDLRKRHAVPRQELHIADHREGSVQLPKHSRISTLNCGSYTVRTPVMHNRDINSHARTARRLAGRLGVQIPPPRRIKPSSAHRHERVFTSHAALSPPGRNPGWARATSRPAPASNPCVARSSRLGRVPVDQPRSICCLGARSTSPTPQRPATWPSTR